MVVCVVGGWGVSLPGVCDCALRCRSEGVGGTCPRVHACAPAGGAGQDRVVGCRWCGEHGDRRAIGRTRRCCESMAETLLREGDRRVGGSEAVGSAAGVCRGGGRGGQGDGVCAAERTRGAAVAVEFGRAGRPGAHRGAGGVGVGLDGAAMAGRWTRSSRGSSGHGSSRETPISRRRPAGCWTSTSGSGTARNSARTST